MDLENPTDNWTDLANNHLTGWAPWQFAIAVIFIVAFAVVTVIGAGLAFDWRTDPLTRGGGGAAAVVCAVLLVWLMGRLTRHMESRGWAFFLAIVLFLAVAAGLYMATDQVLVSTVGPLVGALIVIVDDQLKREAHGFNTSVMGLIGLFVVVGLVLFSKR